MQINRIGVVIRPRNPWESTDLGFSLVQQWWQPFYRVWIATVIPLIFILHLVLYPIAWIIPFVIWWLKPFFDRIILYFLSRALFGDPPGIRQTWRALPTFFNLNLLRSLTIWRFSLIRSFRLPVLQLEGLRGKAQSQRIYLLQQRTRNTATWLTVVCLHFEGLLYLSLFGLLYLMTPVDYTIHWLEFFSGGSDHIPFMGLINAVFSVIVLSVIEPFYVSSGFTLYLNRRTHLEGWDIELIFRRIAMALQTKTILSLLLIMILFYGSGTVPLFAQPSTAERVEPETIQQTMTTILQQSEFQTERPVSSWRYKGTSSINENNSNNNYDFSWLIKWVRWLPQIVEFLLWTALIIVFIVIIRYALSWSERLRGFHPIPTSILAKARSVSHFAHETLSLTQLSERACHLWQTGETFAALSLLYRGTLVALIAHHGVTITESATEGECIRSVKQGHQSVEITAYFMMLTRIWQNAAYAQRLPASEKMQQLCTEWQQHFGYPNQTQE